MSFKEGEVSRFNNCPPPHAFKVWEIKERFPIVNSDVKIPSWPPIVDTETEFVLSEGPARHIVERASLDSGGYASVHRGWDRRLGRYVAVKKFSGAHLKEKESLVAFELEAKTMAKISHPGIPEIYDYSVIDGPDGQKIPVIIMEYVKAENLRDRLWNTGKLLPLNRVLEIVSQVASTADYMDKVGLTHGDLKPGNILLAKPHIKVIDFGNSNWVNPKRAKGISPGYASPEYYSGDADHNSDEYCLAALAFNVLFQRLLKTKSVQNQILRLKSGYTFDRKTRHKINSVLLRGLAEKPEDRYGSCSEFAEAFYPALKNL